MTDYVRRRGDTYADEIVVQGASTRQPVDVTGYTFIMTVDLSNAPLDSGTVVYSVNGVIIDASAGRVGFAPTLLQADQVGQYYYDIQMTSVAGVVRTIDSGTYTYVEDITK